MLTPLILALPPPWKGWLRWWSHHIAGTTGAASRSFRDSSLHLLKKIRKYHFVCASLRAQQCLIYGGFSSMWSASAHHSILWNLVPSGFYRFERQRWVWLSEADLALLWWMNSSNVGTHQRRHICWSFWQKIKIFGTNGTLLILGLNDFQLLPFRYGVEDPPYFSSIKHDSS